MMKLILNKVFIEKNIILCYFSLFIVLYVILCLIGLIEYFPNNVNLVSWDAVWYNGIKDNGYYYDPSRQSSVAFFPLFPYLWRLIGVNAVGISFFNFSL